MIAKKFDSLGRRLEKAPVIRHFLNPLVFIYVYFVVCILQNIPVIAGFVSPVSKLCFLWAVLLIAWDALFTRRLFKMTFWALPLLFLLSFAISVFLNAREVLADGVKHLIHCAIFMVLVFECFAGKSRQQILKATRTLCFLLIGLVMLLSFLALVLFSLEVSVMINDSKVGFWENRLYGVYASPNPGALLALMSSIASVILLCGFGKVRAAERALHIANIVIQFVYFSLTLSKAGSLALITFIIAFGVFFGIPRLGLKIGRWKAIIAVVLGIVLTLFVISGTMEFVRTGMKDLPDTIAHILDPEDNTDHSIELDRVESGDDISNNRFTIWTSCLKLFPQAPFFGFADLNVSTDSALGRFDISSLTDRELNWLIQIEGYSHNAYIQVLMYAGIAGLLVFLLMAVFTVFHLLRILVIANKKALEYKVISVLFSAAAMLVVNGFVESHLLFNRQDPIGFLFWFILGAAVCLANDFRGSESYVSEENCEKFALVAATPLQMLHCAEFVGNDVDGSAGSSDLYIVHTFPTAPKLSEGAKKSGLYNNVYDLKPRNRTSKLRSKLATFVDLFFPRFALESKSCGDKLRLNRKAYRYICASSQTTFTIGMHLVYPQAHIYLYDDGIGSYYGSMVHDYNSGIFEIMNRLFFDGKLIMEADAMYLAVPELSSSTSCAVFRKLPGLPEEKMALVEQMFDYRANDLYRQRRLVYLTQPFGETSGIDMRAEPEIVRVVEKYSPQAVARVHPRQKDAEFGGLLKDTYQNLWEMECLKQITNDHVLVSYCSTSQFMPKLMNDTEPHVVFLYRIFGKEPGQSLAALLQQFAALYRDPEHIHVPETVEELETLLEKLMK